MGLFDVFRRRRQERPDDDSPKLEYGFRGEGLIYTQDGRWVEMITGWSKGERLYPDTMRTWSDGRTLFEDEALSVFRQAVPFAAGRHGKPVVVLNRDDARLEMWERACAEMADQIVRVDYTSNAERDEQMREMFCGILKAGKGLKVDGVEITSEQQIDDVVRRSRKREAE